MLYICRIFFFQAEDGIRDPLVTGVQTCALPISHPACVGAVLCRGKLDVWQEGRKVEGVVRLGSKFTFIYRTRSEERRVGKECRSWWTGVTLKDKSICVGLISSIIRELSVGDACA